MRIVFIPLIAALAVQAVPPKSRDLTETDVRQRRDLSLPQSRLVLNFYDFKSTNSAYRFGTAANLPLHAAWLSTEKNEVGGNAVTRFSRTVPELFMLYRCSGNSLTEAVQTGAAQSFGTSWAPHALGFWAEYANGSVVKGDEFLYDENTIVRRMVFSGTPSAFYLAGRCRGKVEIVKDGVIVRNGNIRYVLQTSADAEFATMVPPEGFRNKTDVSEASWGGAASGITASEWTWWYCKVEPQTLANGELTISAVFDSDSPCRISLTQVASGLEMRERMWDGLLAKVPEPLNMDLLRSVDPKGATAEGIRQAYYKAWIFTIQNVLPPDEKVYPYPQLATGKPSLWDEGESRAPFSAAWESFLGIQFYAYIDPATAWKAFKGLMSLVGPDGMLGGESLPSRKAQTAMVLYALTGDRASLAETYPALCRYMDWRLKITHWVYGEYAPDPDWKDAEFAFSAIVDMEHLAEIARILGRREDAVAWEMKRAAFYGHCKDWFWKTPQTLPVQNWHRTKKPRDQNNTIWVTTGLYMDGCLAGSYLTSMLARFDADYNPEKSFGGFEMPKYPDMSYSVYGLLKQGYTSRARGVMETAVRDIVRAGAPFAEQYIGDEFRPDGVRPSLFGSSMIIDFTMLLNGYKYDRGFPQFAPSLKQGGGVKGLHVRGQYYELGTDGVKATFGGKTYLVVPGEVRNLNF